MSHAFLFAHIHIVIRGEPEIREHMGRRIKYHTEEQREAARRDQSAARRLRPGCAND